MINCEIVSVTSSKLINIGNNATTVGTVTYTSEVGTLTVCCKNMFLFIVFPWCNGEIIAIGQPAVRRFAGYRFIFLQISTAFHW